MHVNNLFQNFYSLRWICIFLNTISNTYFSNRFIIFILLGLILLYVNNMFYEDIIDSLIVLDFKDYDIYKKILIVFGIIMFMIITSLLLVLLEYSRVHGLERYAQMKADTAADSLCAEFQPYLWQEYGILFLNGAYGTETFSEVFIAESLENHLKENYTVFSF